MEIACPIGDSLIGDWGLIGDLGFGGLEIDSGIGDWRGVIGRMEPNPIVNLRINPQSAINNPQSIPQSRNQRISNRSGM
jgi:hypothetical protein